MKAKYLFLDLETTGLDPYQGKILECVAVATTADLVEVGAPFAMILKCYRSDYDNADNFVQDMHTFNGLWNLCFWADAENFTLSKDLVNYIGTFEWDDKRPILAGNSVHFDRAWLAQKCRDAAACLHHRHLDVSSLKLAADDPFPSSGNGIHRSADDVAESILKARELFARMRR